MISPLRRRDRTWLLLGLAAVTAVALVVRLWRVDSLPPGYWYDEAHKSLVALEIARGERAPLYITDNQGIEAGYFWLLAAWFRLTAPSFYGTRVLSALLGAATVPLTFWAIWELYRPLPRARLLALLAAAWLSVLLWHVHWSRLGLETITVPLFAVALLGGVAWAWRRHSVAAFVAVGVVLGLSQYTNPGARLLWLQVAVTYWLLGHGGWRERLRYGAALGLAALVVYLPLGLFFALNPEWFFNRLSFTSEGARAGGLAVWFANAIKTLGSLNFRGDVMPRHNLSLRPALDPVASLCMAAAGLALYAGRAHWRRHGALLAALALGLVPMVFSDGAPGFGRTLGAAPFVAVLPALGLATLVERLSQPVGAVLAAAVLVVSGGLNLYAYFERYPQQPGLFDAFEIGQWTLIDSAYRASESGTGYLILDAAGLAHPATRLAQRLANGDLRVFNGQDCLAYPAHSPGPVTLAVLSGWAPSLRRQFPQAAFTEVLHEPEVYPYGEVLQLTRGSSAAARSIAPIATLGEMVDLLEVASPPVAVAGETVPVRLRWHVLGPLPRALNVFLHLGPTGVVPLAGADGPPCGASYPTDRWHADEIIEHDVRLLLPADLAPGDYHLFVGLYDWVTGERLAVTQAGAQEPNRVLIGNLRVAAP